LADSELLEKLAALRAANCESMPTPEIAILTRSINRLRREGFAGQSLQMGETAPDFEFVDNEGVEGSLYQALTRGPAVLNFFRGYWCSYCRTELEAYERIRRQLDALGCTYFAISPQAPATEEGTSTSYQIVHDCNNAIARDYGLVFSLDQTERDLFASWGLFLDDVNGAWELPIPATYVIKPDRTVGYAYIDVDFRMRCCPEQLLEELRGFCAS